MLSLSREIDESGPAVFSRDRLKREQDLFSERAALFYTPTENIPDNYVGDGTLDVTLPVCLPSWLEFFEFRAYKIPRFWVDLLQRATGKLRWRPMCPARITYITYDSYRRRGSEILAKALTDALKVSTTGRRDGKLLYYFGAIVDDNWDSIASIDLRQGTVRQPSEARCRVTVEQADSAEVSSPSMTFINIE